MTGASWDFSVEPQYGWGSLGKQKATAGWLAALPVFEPHWQVCANVIEGAGCSHMAHPGLLRGVALCCCLWLMPGTRGACCSQVSLHTVCRWGLLAGCTAANSLAF